MEPVVMKADVNVESEVEGELNLRHRCMAWRWVEKGMQVVGG